jgi:anti-anti-sigma factor
VADSSYRVEIIGGMPVVTAPAAVDVNSTAELRQVLLDSPADDHNVVVVDMTGTRVCGFVGFSVLVRAHRRAVANGGELRLVIPADGPVVRALELTGVGRFIPSFSSREEALAAGPAAMIAAGRPQDCAHLGGGAHQPGGLVEGT